MAYELDPESIPQILGRLTAHEFLLEMTFMALANQEPDPERFANFLDHIEKITFRTLSNLGSPGGGDDVAHAATVYLGEHIESFLDKVRNRLKEA